MTYELVYLERIAIAMERIARHLEGEVLVQMRVPETLAADLKAHVPHAVTVSASTSHGMQGLIDMPNDELPEPEKPAATRADAVAALNAFARVHGIEAGKRVLATFGPRLDEVPEDKLADLVATLTAVK